MIKFLSLSMHHQKVSFLTNIWYAVPGTLCVGNSNRNQVLSIHVTFWYSVVLQVYNVLLYNVLSGKSRGGSHFLVTHTSSCPTRLKPCKFRGYLQPQLRLNLNWSSKKVLYSVRRIIIIHVLALTTDQHSCLFYPGLSKYYLNFQKSRVQIISKA